jgi:hypothetical protein
MAVLKNICSFVYSFVCVCVYFSFCFPFGAIAYYVIFFQFQKVLCPDVLEFFHLFSYSQS